MVYSNELRAEARKWVEELERLQRLKPTLKTKCKYSGDEAAMFVEIVKGSDGEYLSAAIPISWIKHFFNLENK